MRTDMCGSEVRERSRAFRSLFCLVQGSNILILAQSRNSLGRLFKKRIEEASYSRRSIVNFLREKVANVIAGGREAYETGLAGLEGNSDKTNQSLLGAD
jgi:hypothetical protein